MESHFNRVRFEDSDNKCARTDSWIVWTAPVLLLLHALLLAYSAWVHSPTFDETAHLPAGLAVWDLHRCDIYPHNPPLVKTIAALPVWMASPETDWRHRDDNPLARPEFTLGYNFVDANGPRAFQLFTLARWVSIPWSILGGWLCFRWATRLYGPLSGLAALVLWCISPHILANGPLITPDVAAASLGLAACYAFWKWIRQPSWGHAIVAGVVLGLAELSKFTWIFLWVLWPALLLFLNRGGRRPWVQSAAIFVVSLYVINIGYLFEHSGQPLGKFQFYSRALAGVAVESTELEGQNRFVASGLDWIPVPLPAAYVKGIDLQKRDFEIGYASYLRGEWKHGGWWYYYLYGLAIKSPVGDIILLILLMALRIGRILERTPEPTNCVLYAHPLAVLALVSCQTGFNHHLRYVLPALPFIFIWLSQLASVQYRWIRALTWGCILASTTSSLATFPHNGSYFNEVIGVTNGPRHLVDSNVSWGQDLLYLRDWLDAHPDIRQIKLAYFGNFDPRVAGIDFKVPPRLPRDSTQRREQMRQLEPGWYFVDASLLYGLNRRIPNGTGGWSLPESGSVDFQYFREFVPNGVIGHTLYLFHLTQDELSRITTSRPSQDREMNHTCCTVISSRTQKSIRE